MKGWRTRIFAFAQILVGALAVVEPSVLKAIMSDDATTRRIGFIMLAQGVITYVLRQVTTTPPGKSS